MYSEELINRYILNINNASKNKVKIYLNTKHVINRMQQRNIHISDICNLLIKLGANRLCELLYYTYLPENIRPFKLQIRSNNCVICLSRRDDNIWSLTTLLSPGMKTGTIGSFYTEIDLSDESSNSGVHGV